LSTWKSNEATIYEHVKKEGDRHAVMLFAFDYDDESEDEFARTVRIYFHFVLYKNGEPVGEIMEGVLENPSPRNCN
jgi:hypothetical protein